MKESIIRFFVVLGVVTLVLVVIKMVTIFLGSDFTLAVATIALVVSITNTIDIAENK